MSAVFASEPSEAPRWQPRVAETTTNNLVPNSSFETGGFGWSSLGQKVGWSGGLSSLFGNVTAAEKFEGDHSLEIALGPGKTATTYYDVLPAATVKQHAPLAMNLGWITVTPGETYTLSAYMKANREGVPARLAMRVGGQIMPMPELTMEEKAVTLSTEWKRYAFTFEATQADVFVGVGPDLSSQPDAEATVWIDAVQFEKRREPSAYVPRAAVEVAIESGRFGNVYSVDAPTNLIFRAVNRTEKAVELDVVLELRDYFDAALPESRQRVSVPAKGNVSEEIALKVPGPGYYKLLATTTGGGVNEVMRFPLAVIHEYKKTDGPFGMNHPPATEEMMQQLRKIGVVWGRNWALD
ncbi:MAG TPA: carbohydrate binding domain-containing protein, partial [Opitutus sp.]|nr:carbohydrate binding domain-containing protein [Opitutus sp.]